MAPRHSPMKRNMAYHFWKRRVVILVHGKDTPSDEEWTQYCEDTKRWRNSIEGILVVSEGGGPNTMQRGSLEAALGEDFAGKTAVVTLSRIARGIVTALSWVNPRIKAFATNQMSAAFEHVGVTNKDEHSTLLAEVIKLRTELGLAGGL